MRVQLAAALTLSLALVAGCGQNGPPVCGDGVRQLTEVCDGKDTGGKSCASEGLGGGTLGCAANCQALDRSRCDAPSTCGNGGLDALERCDGTNVGGLTCEDVGLGAGALGCSANCLELDTSHCGAPPTCGNGVRDGIEVCDGSDLGGATCQLLGERGGTLGCAANCLAYDKTQCESDCVPQCGALECGVDPVCGKPCGTGCDALSVCDAGRCKKTCDLDPITTTQAIDVALTTVQVSGAITLDGAALPDNTLSSSTRGWVVLRNRDTGDAVSLSVGATGAAWSGTVFAGTYDIDFSANSGGNQNVLPYQTIRVASGVALTAATVQNLALKTVAVSGAITLNGAPLPANTLSSSTRGWVVLRNRDGGDSISVSVGASGGTYSGTVFAGNYDADFSANSGGNQNVLPYQTIRVASNLALNAATTQNLALKTVVVSGSLSLNGAALPDNTLSSSTRGWVVFRNLDGGDSLSASVGASGATYQATLFAGRYDVDFSGNSSGNQNVVPYQTLRVASGLTLTQAATQNVALKTVVVSGTLSLNGGALPANTLSSSTRGYVVFRNRDNGDSLSASVGATGTTYQTTVFAATYDVSFSANSSGNQDVLPYQTVRVAAGLALTQAATQNVALTTVAVTGQLTLNGAALPANTLSSSTRGWVVFRGRDSGDSLSVSVGASGATYQTTIFAGTYDVSFSANSGGNQDVLPYQAVRIAPGVAITTATTQNVALKTVGVSGAITLNGAPLPANTLSSSTRGWVVFRSRDNGDSTSISVGANGAMYQGTLFAGTYDVELSANSGGNQNVLPYQRLRIRRGCYQIPACSLAKTDLSGSWSFLLDATQSNDWVITIAQGAGGALSGTYSYVSDRGPITGTRSGDDVTLRMKTYACEVTMTGTVASGCLITGKVTLAGTCYSWDPRTFFATR